MHKLWLKVAGSLVAGSLLTGLAVTALADDTPPAAAPAQAQSAPDRKQDQHRLNELFKALREEHRQEHALRRDLHTDLQELHRLVKLSEHANKTEDLKQALTDIARLREDLKVVHESHKQLRTEWQALKDYRQGKHLDQAAAEAAKIKGLLEAQIDRLQRAEAQAKRLIQDMRQDLRGAGVDPDQH